MLSGLGLRVCLFNINEFHFEVAPVNTCQHDSGVSHPRRSFTENLYYRDTAEGTCASCAPSSASRRSRVAS